MIDTDTMSIQRFRQEAILRCFQGMMASRIYFTSLSEEEEVALEAIKFAEALVCHAGRKP